RARLGERKIQLDLDKQALGWLAEAGYDSVYGARPLKRVIQQRLENPLSTRILEGSIKEGDVVRVSKGEDGLVFKTTKAKAA
ncbi:MAG: hypothetical protein ACPHIA_08825, partial [Alphaproteobacteria bacterium]